MLTNLRDIECHEKLSSAHSDLRRNCEYVPQL
jgi:hypothetical protein